MVKKLPSRIFVQEETDGDDSYLVASYSADGMDADTIIGVYELLSYQKVVITTELVEVKVK